jgi:hypothetical protein
MLRISPLSTLLGVLLCALPATRPALAGDDDGRVSIKVEREDGSKVEIETGSGWLSGLIAHADVDCEADDERSTREMMSSLTRQGEGGVYRGEDEDGVDFVAKRRDGMLRIDKPEDDGKRTLVEMPWEVAQCLMAGIQPAGDLGKRLARGDAKLRFETSNHGARVSIRLE